MSLESKLLWCRKFVDVQLGPEADEAAKNLALLFQEQHYSSYGIFHRGDFRSGENFKLINEFISDHLPTEYSIDGRTWDLQNVYNTGVSLAKLRTFSSDAAATLELFPTVLSIIDRYEL
jgi:hypothetical protein